MDKCKIFECIEDLKSGIESAFDQIKERDFFTACYTLGAIRSICIDIKKIVKESEND